MDIVTEARRSAEYLRGRKDCTWGDEVAAKQLDALADLAEQAVLTEDGKRMLSGRVYFPSRDGDAIVEWDLTEPGCDIPVGSVYSTREAAEASMVPE